MRKLSLRAGARLGALLAISTSLLTLGSGVQSIPAHADPLFSAPTILVGVGSDTIQDLFDAYAGQAGSPYTGYNALTTGTSHVPLTSWDAVQPVTNNTRDCITDPKPGFGSIIRPNGSGEGQAAVSRSGDGGPWSAPSTASCSAPTPGNANNVIDFARSSSGPNTAKYPGTDLSFFPFGRDAVSYAIFDHGSGVIGSLSTAQLKSLYGTTGIATGGTITVTSGTTTYTVHACMVQSGSGTGKFWDKTMGNDGTGTTAAASAVASGCNASPNGPYEENGYNSWASTMTTLFPSATDLAVIPFSAGQWVAQANQASVDRSNNGRPPTAPVNEIGSPDGVSPIVLGSPMQPNPVFFLNTTAPVYGRDLYVVIPTNKTGGVLASPLKTMFTNLKGPASICTTAAQNTAKLFGFLGSVSTCGNLFGQQGYVPNPLT